MGDAQDVREQPGGLFPRVVRAVSEAQPGGAESPLGVPQPVAQPGGLRGVDPGAGAGALQGARSRSIARR